MCVSRAPAPLPYRQIVYDNHLTFNAIQIFREEKRRNCIALHYLYYIYHWCNYYTSRQLFELIFPSTTARFALFFPGSSRVNEVSSKFPRTESSLPPREWNMSVCIFHRTRSRRAGSEGKERDKMCTWCDTTYVRMQIGLFSREEVPWFLLSLCARVSFSIAFFFRNHCHVRRADSSRTLTVLADRSRARVSRCARLKERRNRPEFLLLIARMTLNQSCQHV